MKGIRALLKSNRGRSPRALTGTGDTIYLYDVIVDDDDWGGVSARTLCDQIQACRGDTLHLRINSPGGDVYAARAVEQHLREHPARVVVHIDGLAASAASFLAMAGDEIIMSPGGMMMIHKAWTGMWGNADDFLEASALLEKIDFTLAETYAHKTDRQREEMLALMRDETWLTAAEALEWGFVDSIAGESADKGLTAAARWDLSAYDHAPQLESPAPADQDLETRSRYERKLHYFELTSWRV